MLISQIGPSLLQARKHFVYSAQCPVPRLRDRRQMLLDGERREHAALLRNPTQAGTSTLVARHRCNILAAPRKLSAAHARKSHQRHDQRRLADAVAAEKSETAALLHRERDIFKHDRITVTGGDVVESHQLSHVVPRPNTLLSPACRQRFPPA